MNFRNRRSLATSVACLVPALIFLTTLPDADAASIVKANNFDALNLGSSWTGAVAPTSADIAVFDSTILAGTFTASLGASASWLGLQVTNPGTSYGINATSGATLTLGTSGITLAPSPLGFSNNAAIALTGAAQTWDVGSGRTYTQGGRIHLGSTALTVQGDGATTFGTGSLISGTGSILKEGTGTLTLSHAGNSYSPSTLSGGLTINNGTVAITGVNAAGSGAIVAFGGLATLNISASQLNWSGGLLMSSGSSINISAADGSGTGQLDTHSGTLTISDNNALRGSTFNFNGGILSFSTLTSATFGALTGGSNLTLSNTTPAAVSLTLGSNNASPPAYTGVLDGLGSVNKTGSGTQILNGSNSFSGAITANGTGGTLELGASNTTTAGVSVLAGTLRLNFNSLFAPASNILAPTNVLTLGGGTLAIQGKDIFGSDQTFASTTLSANNSSTVSVTAGIGFGPPEAFVSLGGITRNAGTALVFNLPTGTLSATNGIRTTTGSANALLRNSSNVAFGTIGGTDWAAKDATNAFIIPFSTLGTNYTVATASSLGTSTQNSDISSGIDTTVAASATINTIRFAQNEARTLTIGSGQTLTVTSSGILVSSAVATAGSKITAGTITGGATPDEVIFHQHSSQPFTLDSIVANNGGAVGLSKTGPGTLILTRANTHTGATIISHGRLQLGTGGNLAGSTVTLSTTNPAATFDVNNQTATVVGLSGGSPTGGLVTLGNSGNLSLSSGTYSGSLNGGVNAAITKNGAGTQGFQTGAYLAYYGTINVNAGSIGLFNSFVNLRNATLAITAGASINHGSAGSTQTYGNITGSGAIGGATSGSSGAAMSFGYLGGNVTFSGVISNGGSSGAMAASKFGSGTATLSGVNTYTGSTTVHSGNLVLDYSGGNNVLPATNLVLTGGTATFRGGTGGALNADATGFFTVSAGNILHPQQSKLVLDSNGGTGFTLTLGTALTNGTHGFSTNTRDNGVLFDTSSHSGNVLQTAVAIGTQVAADTNTIKLQNGVLQSVGSFASLGQARATVLIKDSTGYGFATTSGLSIVRNTTTTALTASNTGPTVNYKVSADLTRTALLAFNTLEIDTSGGAVTLDFAANTFTGGAGRAFLATGTNAATVTATTGSSNQPLFLHNYLTGGSAAGQTLTLDVPIANAVISTGLGLTTYTRAHSADIGIQSGIFRMTAAQSWGSTQTGAGVARLTGGVLEIGADLNGAEAGDFTRGVGDQISQVYLQGDTGFSAFGATRTVNLGGATQTMTWGVDRFLTSTANAETNATFKLSSTYSDSTLVFANGINLNARNRTIEVANGSANVDARLSGVLSNSNAVANTIGSLTKTGAGTLELTAANTFNGSTTISAGTLRAAAEDALGGTSGITVNTGGTLLLTNTGTTDRINDSATVTLAGGTIGFDGNVTEGSSPGTGALTLSLSSTIDFANGNAIINFGASAAAIWTGTLSIWNWAGSTAGGGADQLKFGFDSSALSLTSSQLSQISFYSGSGSGFLGTGGLVGSLGEVVPVPEPSAIFIGLGLLGLAGRREFGRSSRRHGRRSAQSSAGL